jgi:hypothetical protein
MSIKNFFMKKMLSSQMKGVPEGEQEKILAMVEKNPELFQKMAEEIQEEMKKGTGQMDAAMKVAQKYQDDLKGLI